MSLRRTNCEVVYFIECDRCPTADEAKTDGVEALHVIRVLFDNFVFLKDVNNQDVHLCLDCVQKIFLRGKDSVGKEDE